MGWTSCFWKHVSDLTLECGRKMIEQQHRCTNCTQTCYMHACMHIYNCETSSSMYLSPMCIETGEIGFYNSCFLKLHEFRLFYVLGWLLFMLINQLPIYPVLAVYQCFFVSMISSAPSPKTMSFNALGAKDSLEKKNVLPRSWCLRFEVTSGLRKGDSSMMIAVDLPCLKLQYVESKGRFHHVYLNEKLQI